MKRNIYWIDGREDLLSFLELSGKGLEPGSFCIATDAVTLKSLQDRGIAAVPMVNYHDSTKLYELFYKALELSDHWYKGPEGDDVTEFEGVSLGAAVKFHSTAMFFHALKAFLAISTVLKQEQPGKICLFENNSARNGPSILFDESVYRRVFQTFAEEGKINLECLPKTKGIKEVERERTSGLGRSWATLANHVASVMKNGAVFAVDHSKQALSRFEPMDANPIRGLVQGASDISYLGQNFLNEILKKRKRVLYYLDPEMNCYLQSQLRRVSIPKNQGSENDFEKLTSRMEKFFNFLQSGQSGILKHPGIPDRFFHHCENIFRRLLMEEIPALGKYVLQVKTAIRKHRINIAIITNHLMPKTVALILAARDQGIPVLHIPHGHNYCFVESGEITLSPHVDPRYFPYRHTHEATGLKQNYDVLRKHIQVKEKLIFGGLQAFEPIKNPSRFSKKRVRKKMGFDENDYIVFFGTTAVDRYKDKLYFPSQVLATSFVTKKLYEDLLLEIKKHPRLKLILKFRPMDIMVPVVREIIAQEGIANVFIVERNLGGLLQACDAILLFCTNVGYEALYYDLPIVQYIWPGPFASMISSHFDAAIPVNDFKELPGIFDRLRTDENFRTRRIAAQKRFLKESIPGDGWNAHQRMAEIIDQLALTGKLAEPASMAE